jgi:uncharacterized membrane protein
VQAVKEQANQASKRFEFRIRGHEVTRIEAFSDVVFGFALTLMVVSLEVPHTFTELLADMRGFVPFAVCFALLGQIWWIHHEFFRRYGLQDALTAALNFALLFVVVFYVYPLKFLFTGVFNEFTHHAEVRNTGGTVVPWLDTGQVPTLFVIYGLGYAAVFLIFVMLYWHALRKRQELDLSRLEVFDTYTKMMESGCLGVVGILCAVTAVLVPENFAGRAGYVFFLIPVGMFIIGSQRGKARRKLEAALSATDDLSS